jgi:LSD1 subclass zinc finger protein
MERVATEILCRQCTAPLTVEPGADLVACQYCGTTNHVDRAQTVLHYMVRPTVRPDAAVAALRRWMAGNDTIKGLDQAAHIADPVYQLFPMWLVRAQRDGAEAVYLQPAAATTTRELKALTVPAADLEPYQGGGDDGAIEATVPYNAMRGWLARDHDISPSTAVEAALVHVPIYMVAYQYEETRYSAVVDAATSGVFADVFPAKKELPYQIIAGVAFLANFLIALLPLGGLLFGGMDGFTSALSTYFLALPLAALFVFILAAIVAART